MILLKKYYSDHVDQNFEWKNCTRYLAGFILKVSFLNFWQYCFDYKSDGWTKDFLELSNDFWALLELGKDEEGELIEDILNREYDSGKDHYPNASLMVYVAETVDLGDYIDRDILECIGIVNDLFIGRRDSYEMYSKEYCTKEEYNPSINWPLPRSGPPYGRRPYLQGQDPVRATALIWVPVPILRFAFFAKEVARFGRPFDGMRNVAQEQLDSLDFTQIHSEYRLILKKVLELEDTPEARQSLDILSNNLFLGEKPLTQAWVEGPEELPWIR